MRNIFKKAIVYFVLFTFVVSNSAYASDGISTLRPSSLALDGNGQVHEALAVRLQGTVISNEEHKGIVGTGGINKIARLAILTYQAKDLKQGTRKGLLSAAPDVTAKLKDYEVPLAVDNFFNIKILPILKTKLNSYKAKTGESDIRIEETELARIWDEWTIRLIPNWRTRCKQAGMPDDIVEHYGRGRVLILLDYDDYIYLQSLPNGKNLIADILFHGFMHIAVDRQNASGMESEEIEAYVRSVAPIAKAQSVLLNTEKITAISDKEYRKAQSNRLSQIKTALNRMLQESKARYSNDRYNSYIDLLRGISLEINYMDVYPDNMNVYNEILRLRHDISIIFSPVIIKHASSLGRVRDYADEDMQRYIDFAIEAGIISSESGKRSLDVARSNLEKWFSPTRHIPDYMRAGIVKAMLEGRSEDIIYSFGSNSKESTPEKLRGWKEFGTAGIRNEAVQSSNAFIRGLELAEFARADNDPRKPILTGPYLINGVSLIRQAMTIVKLVDSLKSAIDAGTISKDTDKRFIENIKRRTITIAYDSRLNGKYFAYLLAVVFLENGFKVNMFDAPAGVPGGVIASMGGDFFGDLAKDYDFNSVEGSVFGILISASHSEPWFNGFKVFLGYLLSQVDSGMKNKLKKAMIEIDYDDMPLETLGSLSINDLRAILKSRNSNLTWFGSENPSEEVVLCGGEFTPFYPLYYRYLSKRSPVSHISGEGSKKIINARNQLDMIYTAFFGAGAKGAADLTTFFNNMGYKNIEAVKKQTDSMDGRFPGHLMPDPGVAEGWMSNLWNYIEQLAGKNFSQIEEAVERLNQKEAACATDPDIDRAGIMLGIPHRAKGNIKEKFIRWLDEHSDDIFKKHSQAARQRVMGAINRLDDKILLTANDAWAFIAFYRLKIMEESGLLRKDRLYIIEKSHVTTSALCRVAEYYRNKNYHVYVVDTYVGFTEIGKKSRDLFDLARQAWQLKEVLEMGKDFKIALDGFKQRYAVLKERVPYETAGIELVDSLLEKLEQAKADTGSRELIMECIDTLNIIAHVDILMGAEESNGYGELGRYNPKSNKIENAHIADKDGSLGVYMFLELLVYGKAILDKSGYDMYVDMLKQIGWVSTDNQFLLYPGFKGNRQKADTMQVIEQQLALYLQKAIDMRLAKQSSYPTSYPKFFDRYEVTGVTIYRDGKYDNIYAAFPEEGVRFNLNTPTGFKASTTFRPSGTGGNNRNYNWVEADVPQNDEDIEVYRARVSDERRFLQEDFFGKDADTEGRNHQDKDARHFIVALRDALNNSVDSKDAVINLLKESLGVEAIFTKAEEELYEAVQRYMESPFSRNVILHNASEWGKYLVTAEAKQYPVKINFFIGGKRIQIPNALAKSWLASLTGYLSLLIRYESMPEVRIACDDQEIASYIARHFTTDYMKVIVTDIPDKYEDYTGNMRPQAILDKVARLVAEARPHIPAGQIRDIISSHRHITPHHFGALDVKIARLADQAISIYDMIQAYSRLQVKTVLIYNPYEDAKGDIPEGAVDRTEVIIASSDLSDALDRQIEHITGYNGIPAEMWAYEYHMPDGPTIYILVFEIEDKEAGNGRLKDFIPAVEYYKTKGYRIFEKAQGPLGRAYLNEVNEGEIEKWQYEEAAIRTALAREKDYLSQVGAVMANSGILAFDVDNTLLRTDSKATPPTEEKLTDSPLRDDFLSLLALGQKISIITSAGFEQQKARLTEGIENPGGLFTNMDIFSASGAQRYVYDVSSGSYIKDEDYRDLVRMQNLLITDFQKIYKILESVINKYSGYYEDNVEIREGDTEDVATATEVGMIGFKKFIRVNGEDIRFRVIKDMRQALRESGIDTDEFDIRPGGSTTINVVKKGLAKNVPCIYLLTNTRDANGRLLSEKNGLTLAFFGDEWKPGEGTDSDVAEIKKLSSKVAKINVGILDKLTQDDFKRLEAEGVLTLSTKSVETVSVTARLLKEIVALKSSSTRLNGAPSHEKPSSAGEIILNRENITEEAGKMLEQIRKYASLPLVVQPEALHYLADKDGLFDNWEDVFNYFANLEFEKPVYQIRDVKTFDEKPVRVFAGYTDESGITGQIAAVDEVRSGLSVADMIEPTTTIRATVDDRFAIGALDKAEIRPVSALSVAMIDSTAINHTAAISQPAYYMQRGVFATRDDIRFAFENPVTRQRFDITIMRPGIFGADNELLHTSGHYHKPKWKPEIYQVVYGKAAYLLQKTREPLDADGVSNPLDIERAIMIEAEAGEPVVIFPGYGHVTTNLSVNRPLVMVNWLTWDQSSQYGAFIRGTKADTGDVIGVGGGCWYAVVEDDHVVYKPNPNHGNNPGQYRSIPDLEVAKLADTVRDLGLRKNTPIYSIVNDKEAFLKLARYLNEPFRDEFKEVTPENVFEILSSKGVKAPDKASSSGQSAVPAVAAASMAREFKSAQDILLSAKPDELIYKHITDTERALSAAQKALVKVRHTMLPDDSDLLDRNIALGNTVLELARLSAPVANYGDGCMVIFDTDVIPDKLQRQAVIDMFNDNQLKTALEGRLSAKVALLSDVRSGRITLSENAILISNDKKLDNVRLLNITKVNNVDGYFPAPHLIALAKGLASLDYDNIERLYPAINRLYNKITRLNLSRAYIEGFINNTRDVFEIIIDMLPGIEQLGQEDIEKLHRQALMALIAA